MGTSLNDVNIGKFCNSKTDEQMDGAPLQASKTSQLACCSTWQFTPCSADRCKSYAKLQDRSGASYLHSKGRRHFRPSALKGGDAAQHAYVPGHAHTASLTACVFSELQAP